MYQLTKLLFAITDFLARLVMAFSMAGVVAFPFVGPIYARMASKQITTLSIIGTCLIWLAAAVGAYAITRRQVLGFGLLLVPVVASFVCGQFELGLLMTAVTAVFSMAFLLAFLEVRAGAASDSTALQSVEAEPASERF